MSSWGEGALAKDDLAREESSDDSTTSFSSSAFSRFGSSEDSSSSPSTRHSQNLRRMPNSSPSDGRKSTSFSSSGEDLTTLNKELELHLFGFQKLNQGNLSFGRKFQLATQQLLRPFKLLAANKYLFKLRKYSTEPLVTTCATFNRQTRESQKPRNNFFPGNSRILSKMYNFSIKYHVEICIILFLLASGMPFLRSKPLKTRNVKSPAPFFDVSKPGFDDLVEDHYRGDYVELVQTKIPKTPSFVFYYAPWDSECLVAKSVFLEVARHFRHKFGDQIKFYAVNCWWPEGQCRRNYKNLSHYPIFVAHSSGAGGIIYNGPIRVELMVRFINLVLFPLTRIDTEEELWGFRAQHDAVMLAYFNFSTPSAAHAYNIYLQMALRHLEVDPLGQVGFGAFVNKQLADKYFVGSANSISLVLFNEIHTAKWQGAFSARDVRAPIKQVVDWIMERTKTTPITWAYRIRSGFSNRPVSLGSIDLAQDSGTGPVILLITKRYFPSAHSPMYMQVKEVAIDYFNCNKSGNVTKLRRYCHKLNGDWLKLWTLVQEKCKKINTEKHIECATLQNELQNWHPNIHGSERESLAYYEKNVSDRLNFTGYSCKSKRPFKFIAVDPSDVPYFLDMLLGTTGHRAVSLQQLNESQAFIIDTKQHIMVQLPSLRASEVASAIHKYSEGTMAVKTVIPVDSVQGHPLKKLEFLPNALVHEMSVDELNSLIERDLRAMDQSEHNRYHIFVMYTTHFCGFCGVALTHFMSLARFLSSYNVNIRLVKVNIFKKSLPEPLEPGEIPSFLFLPAHNRSDLRLYPPGKPITTKNLLQFLLSEIDTDTRVAMSVNSPVCSSDLVKRQGSFPSHANKSEEGTTWYSTQSPNKGSCLATNRRLVTAQILSVLNTVKNCSNRMKVQESSNSKTDHNYYDRDKLFFMQQIENSTYNNGTNGGDTCNAASAQRNFKEIDDARIELAAWNYEVLDHLRSTRLMLDLV